MPSGMTASIRIVSPRPFTSRWRSLAVAIAVGCGMAFVAATPATADVRFIYVTNGEALFSVAAPDGWLVATGETQPNSRTPRILGMNPEADYSLWIGFFSPQEVGTLEQAEAYVKGMGGSIVQDATVERESNGRLGEMAARYYSGSGTRDGAPVDFTVALAELPDARVLIGVFVGEYGARSVYEDSIAAIVNSVKAAEGGR
jgi:hypothetical protein